MDKDLLKKTEELLKNYNILLAEIKYLDDESELKEKKNLKLKLDIAIDSLEKNDRKVIKLRYLSDKKSTWKEISKEVNLSESCCRQTIKNRALKHIYNIVYEKSFKFTS